MTSAPLLPLPGGRWLAAACALAVAAPLVLAYQAPPSPTLLAQCLAVVLWGLVAVLAAPRRIPHETLPVLVALLIPLLAAAASWRWGGLPRSLALLPIGLLAAAALLVVSGADLSARGRLRAAGTGLAWGLLAAGLLGSLVAAVQVFATGWTDEVWIASSPLAGRAIGNLRHANHLSTLLVCACAAAWALHRMGAVPRATLWPIGLVLVAGIALSGSRMGLAGLLLLAVAGAARRGVAPAQRAWLLALPLGCALVAAALLLPGGGPQGGTGIGARLLADAGPDTAAITANARPVIWANTLALVAQQPWTGVGFGQFNLAWTLTPFETRANIPFDHAHNLALHLAAELGVPLAVAVLAALALGLWHALRQAWHDRSDTGPLRRLAVFMVGWMLVHSMLEHPLWFAYLLLPTAFAWGLALGRPRMGGALDPAAAAWKLYHPLAGGVVAAAGLVAALDYWIVADIYRGDHDSGPVAHRIARGQQSPLFAHHADYASIVVDTPPYSRTMGLQRAKHMVVDPRLQIAWAQQLAATGRLDAARWLAQRLRESRSLKPEYAAFFAPCARPDAAGAPPFQCVAPAAQHGWRALAALPMTVPQPAGGSTGAVVATTARPAAPARPATVTGPR